MTKRESNSVRYHKIALNHWLESNDIERKDRHIVDSHIEDRKFRINVWLRDSLLWSLEELELNRNLYVFRGFIQAAGYATEVGNDSVTADCIIFLRNVLEDRIMATGDGSAL